MKARVWIIVAVLALAAIVGGVWWTQRGDTPAEDSGSDKPSAAEIVAARRAQRAAQPTESGPASASGQVTRADGTAVVGALVLMNAKAAPSGASTWTGVRARPRVARTDAAGEFSFSKLPPGAYAVSASATGLLPGRIDSLLLEPDADRSGLSLVLAPGGHRVSGQITDIVGGSVDGALVKALRLDEGNTLAAFARAPSVAMADDEGAYAMWLPDGAYVLTAQHVDYVDATSQLRIDGGDRNRDITMTPGAVIEGKVVTRTGEAVAGARVTWTSLNEMAQGGGNPAMGRTAVDAVQTDERGQFRVTGLAPGLRSLSAVADGLATRQPVEVPLGVAEEVSGVELVLDEAFKISGFVVTDAEAQDGIAGVMISSWSMQPAAAFAARGPSEADGYFEIDGVQPGNYFISAVSEQALPTFMSKSVTVSDADVDDVLLTLGTGVHLRGRVEPAVPASITVEIDMKSAGMLDVMRVMGNGFVRGRASEDGAFDLFPIAGDSKLSLVATSDDGRKGRLEVEVGSDDMDDLVIALEPRARLAGRVVDAAGAAVEGVEVQVTPTAVAGPGMSMSFDAAGGIPGGGQTGATDETGHYEVRGLDAGTYKIRVNQAQGPALAWAEPDDPEQPAASVELTLGEGEQRDNYELRIEARDGVISGRVVGADGQPLADAWVRVTRQESPGEYIAQLSERFERFSGGPKKRAKRRKSTEDTSREQSSPEKAAARQLSHRFAEPPALTDHSGHFEVSNLRAGTYLVIADGPRGSGRGQAEGIVVGSKVTVVVEPLAGLEGRVQLDGKAVSEYTISLQGPDVRSRRIKDGGGHYELTRLDPGLYEVVVDSSEGSVTAEVEIAAAQTATLNLKLDAFATLRGTLVDTVTGEPMGGMNVVVQGRAADPAAMLSMFSGGGPKTDDDGTFEVDRIRAGEGNVMFIDPDADGFQTVASAKFDVEAGADEDLGTISGVTTGDVPADARGDLGMSTRVATVAERPLSPDADDGEEPDTDDGDDTKRLWVDSVEVDGPAAKAGVEPGDEIVSIRNVGVQGTGAAAASLTLGASHVRVGEDVSLEIRRGELGRRVTVRAQSR